MFYRDYMQKFRPLYAPDGPEGVTPPAGEVVAASSAPPVETAAAPAADAAPAGDAAPADAPAAGETPATEPTLLESASATPPAEGGEATTESPAPDEAAKTEGDGKKPEPEAKDAAKPDPEAKDATAAEPPAPIKYDAFTLPEGINLDAKVLSRFEEIVGPAQVSQEVAQKLVDFYVEERKQDVARAEAHQRDVWHKLNDTWKSDFRNDPELGGNREQTSLAMARAVVEEFGGTPEQIKDLIAHTKLNGMGNYPGFIRMLVNIGNAMSVFEDSEAPANPSTPKPQRGPGNRGWYSGTMGNGAAKA